jgi:1-acyl-sn-glycerol-3-phosphate acyltransferase
MRWQATVKLFRITGHVLSGYWQLKTAFRKMDEPTQCRAIEQWAQQALGIMGVTLRTKGLPASGPVIRVANHISWLDILVMHAASHCRFVAKADISRWPLIGAMTTAAHSLYITRESSRDAMRVVHRMADALRQGDILAVFPEGTTGDGSALLPFHGNLLQAAITLDAPIQPVALKFVDAMTGQRSFAPCYIGDDTLVGSLWRTLKASHIEAVVQYGELQHCAGMTRREWAADLRQKVNELL